MTGIISDNVGRTSGLIKSASGGGGGAWTKIKTLTASGDSTLSFVNGSADVVLDSTYPVYVFMWNHIHPSATGQFNVNFSSDTGSNYNVTKTTSVFDQQQIEAGGTAWLGYASTRDLAQSTAAQRLHDEIQTDNDYSGLGELWVFGPGDTTFVKHFFFTTETFRGYAWKIHGQGYCNTTSAIDAIQFSMSSGTMDFGKINLYGIGDS